MILRSVCAAAAGGLFLLVAAGTVQSIDESHATYWVSAALLTGLLAVGASLWFIATAVRRAGNISDARLHPQHSPPPRARRDDPPDAAPTPRAR